MVSRRYPAKVQGGGGEGGGGTAKGREGERGGEVWGGGGGGGAGVGWEEEADFLASDDMTQGTEGNIGAVLMDALHTVGKMGMGAFYSLSSLTQSCVMSYASIVGEAGMNKALSALVGIVVGALVYSRGR